MPSHQVRHICMAHKADTQKLTLQKSLRCANARATLCGWTQTHIVDDREEGRTYNIGGGLPKYGRTLVIFNF